MSQVTYNAVSVKPPKELRPALQQLARDLDTTEAQILARSAEAIIRMVEASTPTVPQLVTATKVLRKEKATFSDRERPFQKSSRVLHGEPVSESPSRKTAAKHKSHK